MVMFFALPRELRDMIYTEVILYSHPRPLLGHPQWRTFRFRRVEYAQSSVTGEFGCAYSLECTPTTCANLLCCNRQVNREMLEVMRLIKKTDSSSDGSNDEGDALAARIDVIAEDESFHYFTFLSVPLVKTTPVVYDGKSRILPAFINDWMSTYLAWPHRWLCSGTLAAKTSTSRIEKLIIDIRLAGDRTRKWTRNNNQSDRTSWAVCAALKRLMENGPDLSSSSTFYTPPPSSLSTAPTTMRTPPRITIGHLVLNVVPPPSSSAVKFLPRHAQPNEVREGMVHPQSVASELLDVWAKIWRGTEYKGVLYQSLLEGVDGVEVCVDGASVGIRPLGKELRRGRRGRDVRGG
ncbi:hypothetical protein P280DRAFT_140769 [Massarina eburnea CBS 473.64]|uniref:Uncharacterized protein n=1 Tax=Massarina eburnea CBS 473.64 TaxID=1395130 RepID=A0A6A6RQS5_9PLEO|nr:hypothetical protein P280DRAFT_140769 [Massarina eburnea CBS 473.64]